MPPLFCDKRHKRKRRKDKTMRYVVDDQFFGPVVAIDHDDGVARNPIMVSDHDYYGVIVAADGDRQAFWGNCGLFYPAQSDPSPRGDRPHNF